MPNPNIDFWKSKRVLVTGHTGFKGAWLSWWLHRMGADVVGAALEPSTQPNLFSALNLKSQVRHYVCDIRDSESLFSVIQSCKPDIVFHLAAQALVRASYAHTLETYSTNVMGTANLLQAITGLQDCRAVVMVTTDKVYRNNEWVWPYRETDHLGGHDPYSASKAASEIIIESYKKSFLLAKGTAIASARAGNVIGGGDWSADRLIPDAVRAWSQAGTLSIRNPHAIRPWQHVLEPVCAYMVLAERLFNEPQLSDSYNFGPHANEAVQVSRVAEIALREFGQGHLELAEPTGGLHEAQLLTLDVSKSKKVLGVQPRLPIAQAIQMTMAWYRDFFNGIHAPTLCERDLRAFEEASQ
jgi:CDP-glucose 4,6-dehydratase